MMSLSIIIGFEEIKICSVFDVVASWFPITHIFFFALVASLKILQVELPLGFKLDTSDFSAAVVVAEESVLIY